MFWIATALAAGLFELILHVWLPNLLELEEEKDLIPEAPASMPLRPWDVRYYRISRTYGHEVRLVTRVPNTRGRKWFVVNPEMMIHVVNPVNTEGSCTENPLPGVGYQSVSSISRG